MKGNEIKSYFINHPTVEEFYFTSDGQCFFNENDAWNHSSNLKDRKITSINRITAELADNDKDFNLKTPIPDDTPGNDFTIAAPEEIAKHHLVTEEDLDKNPDWEEEGVKVGDTIELSGMKIRVVGEDELAAEANIAATTNEASTASKSKASAPKLTAQASKPKK